MAVVAAVAASGGASAVVDVWSRRVPNTLTLGIAALGVSLAALFEVYSLVWGGGDED